MVYTWNVWKGRTRRRKKRRRSVTMPQSNDSIIPMHKGQAGYMIILSFFPYTVSWVSTSKQSTLAVKDPFIKNPSQSKQ